LEKREVPRGKLWKGRQKEKKGNTDRGNNFPQVEELLSRGGIKILKRRDRSLFLFMKDKCTSSGKVGDR